MNVKNLSIGMVGALLTLGPASCVNNGNINKPREELKKYMTSAELAEADKVVWRLSHQDDAYSDKIVYWNSLLIESKSKKAYLEGQKMIQDSLAGKPYIKPKFEYPIKNEIHSSGEILRKKLIHEFSKNIKLRNLASYIKNEPPISSGIFSKGSPNKVHYFYQILSVARQKDAFEKGADFERAKLIEK